jgi:hypothetical protein
MHYKRKQRTGSANYVPARRNRGTGTVTHFGYVAVGLEGNKHQEHRLIVERALGKPLPAGAEIHHVNGNRSDNSHANLVVCPDRAYHKLLHQRQRSLEACGNPNYRKCPFCKTYSDPANMSHNKSSRYFFHAECKQAYRKENP